ncbi:MAG: DNA cytosine methyltransferase [Ketobacter sp.]|nr:DNA cytosine methyltransferase [Ketobacter sp.]
MIDYPAHLDMMWQKAIAPRDPNAPTVISTFAGGGGSSTGYHMAGFRELLAVEWDDNAVETLRLNYPDLDIYHGDIAKLTVKEVLKRTGLQPGDLDIFDGSPPCQGFSTAGIRVMSDPRNQLFKEYVRLLRGLQPKVFVMENVSGMVKGKMKLVFVEILKELKASGYKVSARLLNAMYFHVPQSRQRLIFIGVRDDLGIEPSHPGAESGGITLRRAGINHEIGVRKSVLNREYHKGRKRRFNPSDVAYAITKQGAFGVRLAQLDPIKIDDLKKIASYPPCYELAGNRVRQWQRIGNSVPPLFMEAIARHIRTEILDKANLAIQDKN